MGDIFLREVKNCQWPSDNEADLESLRKSLITVTEVRITPDLSIARIYLSIMIIGSGTVDGVMALIRANGADLRRRLGMREGKQLRIIPQLEFYIDDTLDYIENINRLLKQ
jgi:ribosome-binding factor A